MRTRFKISVIVPVYNVERYLDRCLESLVGQTLQDLEIILVNDASPDDSIGIMNRWKREYPDLITLIDSKVNLRQGGARNLGLDIARGEWIAFVDSDDWVEPNAMEILYNRTRDREVDIVYGTCYYRAIEENGDFQRETITNVPYCIDGEVADEARKKMLVAGLSVCSCLYNRSWIEKNRLRFIEHMAYEDNLWGVELAAHANRLACVDEPFYNYRFNPISTTASQNTHAQQHYRSIAEKIVEYAKRHFDGTIYGEEIEWLHIYFFYVALKGQAFKSSPVRYDYLNQGKILKRLYPAFRKNNYYLQKYPLAQRLKMDFADHFPRTFVLIKKVKEMIIPTDRT